MQSWVMKRPGVVSIRLSIEKPAAKCIVPIRVASLGVTAVIPFQVEVLTLEQYEEILRIKKGVPAAVMPLSPQTAAVGSLPAGLKKNRIGLYFRASIRKQELERRKRDARSVGGIRQRVFPPQLLWKRQWKNTTQK